MGEPLTAPTVGTRGKLTRRFTRMAVFDNRFADATREVLAQRPHRLGHLGQEDLRVGQLRLQAIEPLVKALMEIGAQALPLGACTDLG